MMRNRCEKISDRGEKLLPHLRDIELESSRFFKDKKGQLGKTITILPVFVLIFVIIILFISLTAGIIPFRQIKSPIIVESNLERGILYQPINVDGSKVLIVEGLFKYPGKKIGLVEDPAFQVPFLIAMKKFFEEHSINFPPEKIAGFPDICLMLGIDTSVKNGRSLSFVRKVDGSVIQGDNLITLKVPVHRYVVYGFPTKKLESFSIKSQGKEAIISYYYGACNGGKS